MAQQQPTSSTSYPSSRTARVLAGATAVLVVVVLGIYLALVRSQGGPPAVWFVSVLVVVIAASGAAVAGRARPGMAISAILLGACVLLGVFSVGLLLVPALVTAILSAALAGPGRGAAVRPPVAGRA